MSERKIPIPLLQMFGFIKEGDENYNPKIPKVNKRNAFATTFAGSHSKFTDPELVNETVLELATLPDFSLENSTILVVLDVVFLTCLIYLYDIEPEKITFYSDHPVKTDMARSFGVTKILEGHPNNLNTFLEIEMKFDVVIGNPPFSKANAGKTNGTSNKPKLYPEFYKKSVEMASIVAMVMPDTTKATVLLKNHNDFIMKTAYHIGDVTQSQQKEMGVQQKMFVVFYDKNKKANVANHFLSVDYQNTIPFKKGKGGTSYTNPTIVVNKMVRAVLVDGADVIQVGDIKPSSIVKSAYAVVLGIRLNEKGFNVDIIQPNGCSISGNVYYIECETLQQAQDYKAIIEDVRFYGQLLGIRGNSNTVSLSKLKSVVV